MPNGGVVVILHLYSLEQCQELNFRHQKRLKNVTFKMFLSHPGLHHTWVYEDSAHCRGSKLGGTAGKNVIRYTLNFLLHLSYPLLSFVPRSGIELDLNACVNDPSSLQPTKKALWGTRSCSSLPPGQHLPPFLLKKVACIPTRKLLSHPPQKLQWHCLYCTILPVETNIHFFSLQPSTFNRVLIARQLLTMHWGRMKFCKLPRMPIGGLPWPPLINW